MKLTNSQIMERLENLSRFLDRRDIVGYAAARNTRILTEAVREFTQIQNVLIRKYGEQLTDNDGNEVDEIALSFDSDNFPDFIEEIRPYAEIEQEINLIALKYEQAIGLLSGTELLALDWMFEE